MSQQPIEANVVLSADTSGYDSSMSASAAQTEALGKSIDTLTGKLDKLSKSAGKKMLGFAAADVAGITAATTAYGAFEKQMTSLSAQAAVLNRTMEGQKATLSSYASSVNGLRAAFGTSTTEATALVQTLSKVQDSTSSVDKLATTFTKLGSATQESSVNLAQSMLQLQRSMGVPQRETEKYANQLTILSARSNASAQSILDFSQQLAPVGRMVNMSMTDIMGVSTAFQKAGQDGYQAASGFNKMMTDIAYASQSGSPDLAKYANLVGMTVSQFKELGGTDKYLKIFDSLNRQGPAAINTLNRLGYDGMRMQRSITAMAQQGGPGQEILAARNADPNAMTRGSAAANDGLVDSLARLRSELAMTGEALGKNFAPYAKAFVDAVEKVAGVVRALAGGPLGQLASLVGGIAAPFAAMAGTVLLAAKAMATFSTASLALRGSFARGMGEGRRGFGTVVANQVEGNMGPIGQEIAADGSWIQRPLYNTGIRAGSGYQRYRDAMHRQFPNRFPGDQPSRRDQMLYRMTGGAMGAPHRPGLISQAAGLGLSGIGWAAHEVIGQQYSPMWGGGMISSRLPGAMGRNGLDHPTQRQRFFNKQSFADYAPFRGLRNMWNSYSAPEEGFIGPMTQAQHLLANGPSEVKNAGSSSDQIKAMIAHGKNAVNNVAGSADVIKEAIKSSKDRVSADSDLIESTKRNTKAFLDSEKANVGFAQGMRNLGSGLGKMMGSLGSAGVGTLAAGGRLAGRGLLSAGLGIFGGPLGLGMAGVSAAGLLWKAHQDSQGAYKYTDQSGMLNPYMAAGGITGPSRFSPMVAAQQGARTVKGALQVTTMDRLAGKDSDYKLTNTRIKGMKLNDALTMLSPNFQHIKNSPQALQALQTDLISEFGVGGAQSGMRQLMDGSAFKPGDLMSTALNQKQGGFMSFGKEDKGDVSKSFSRLTGTYQDQVNEVARTQGPQAAMRLQTQQMGQMIGMFTRQAGGFASAPTPTPGGEVQADPLKTERTAFGQSFAKDMLGIKLNDAQAAGLTFDPKAKGDAEQLSSFLKNNAFGRNAVFTKDQQTQLLTGYGINASMRLKPEEATDQLMRAMRGASFGDQASDLVSRVNRVKGVGDVFQTFTTKDAFDSPENVNAQIVGMREMFNSMKAAGKSAPEIVRIMGNVKAVAGVSTEDQYKMAAGVQQMAQTQYARQSVGLGRVGQFKGQVEMFKQATSVRAGDEQQQANQEAAASSMFDQMEGQRQYFQSLLVQQREFNVQQSRARDDFAIQRDRMDYEYNLNRKRAEDDFHQQQMWQVEDYHKSRSRAEFDFHLQRERAQANFDRQMKRGYDDYTLSRKRQEQDYQHSVVLMVEQAAMQSMDIYKRTQVQRTTSANWLVFNANEQLTQMKQQSGNLDKLRGAGMSDDVIQQLGLTDTKNAQQLSRLVGDVASDPKIVQQFNAAISERLKGAKALVTDESSTQWQEFNRQYDLSRKRGAEDFAKSNKRARQDFKRSLGEQETDFDRSMSRMATDFEQQQDRANNQFDKSMKRSAADYNRSVDNMVTDFNKSMVRAGNDLNRAAQTIDGNFETILTDATKKLGGHAQKQAAAVLAEFKGLKTSTNPVAIDLMQSLSDIFGVKYTAPKIGKSPGVTASGATAGDRHHMKNMAAGGVLPGYSPGVDNHVFQSPTGGTLHLSGGESVMVPEWTKMVGGEAAVKRMNEAARSGARDGMKFASGGVVWPVPGRQTGTYPGHDGVDINRGSGWDDFHDPIVAARGGKVSYVGTGKGYGQAIFIATDAGLTNIYGHTDKTYVHAGQMVTAGQKIGLVGNTGHSSAPHLHFGVNPGMTTEAALAFLSGATHLNLTRAGGTGQSFKDIIQKQYPLLEQRVSELQGVNPFGPGDYSGVINKMAKVAYKRMQSRYLNLPDSDMAGGMMGSGSVPAAPDNVHGNKKIVQDAAASRGWNSGRQWDALYQLVMHESGFRNTAQNPSSTAYGMFQFLDSTWAGAGGQKTSNPALQAKYGLNYIKNAYKTPTHAWDMWQSRIPHWYGDGAIFNGGAQQIGIGERGPEMVLPLNERGADFLQNLMQKMSAGNDAKSLHTAGYAQPSSVHNTHNYQIDRSTTFSGPITVQANNPAELINQMKARARTAALTNAAKGGVKVS